MRLVSGILLYSRTSPMRNLVLIPIAAISLFAADASITSNPLPEKIIKRGLAVEIKDLARLPDTRALRPAADDVNAANYARVSYGTFNTINLIDVLLFEAGVKGMTFASTPAQATIGKDGQP